MSDRKASVSHINGKHPVIAAPGGLKQPGGGEGEEEEPKDPPLKSDDHKALAIIQSKKLRGTAAVNFLAPFSFSAVLVVAGFWIYHLPGIDATSKGLLCTPAIISWAGVLVAQHFVRDQFHAQMTIRHGKNTQLYTRGLHGQRHLHMLAIIGVLMIIGGIIVDLVVISSSTLLFTDKIVAFMMTLITIILVGTVCIFIRNSLDGQAGIDSLKVGSDRELDD